MVLSVKITYSFVIVVVVRTRSIVHQRRGRFTRDFVVATACALVFMFNETEACKKASSTWYDVCNIGLYSGTRAVSRLRRRRTDAFVVVCGLPDARQASSRNRRWTTNGIFALRLQRTTAVVLRRAARCRPLRVPPRFRCRTSPPRRLPDLLRGT